MNCPKCGSEIQEGHLYCEKCGEEIIIVPDYDPSLDENIRQNLASVVNDELNNKKGFLAITRELGLTKELADIKKNKKDNISESKPKINYKLIVLLAVSAIVVTFAVILILNIVVKSNSYENQYEQALELFDEGKYEESIKKTKRVISIKPEEERPKLLLCDNYYELGKYDEALAVLEQLMETYPSDMNIFERLVKNYDAKGDNNSISELVEKSQDENVKDMYGKYNEPALTFSPEEGIYPETQYISLSSNMDGTIYYTLDGSEPSDKSLKYSDPVEVKAGNTLIKAIVVNSAGESSSIVEANYTVEMKIPEIPVLESMPGSFTTPSVISVTVPEGEICYYTIDGLEPTLESEKYEGPIPMYIGTHSYKFACISEDEISSELVDAEYTLDVVNLVNIGTAVNNLTLLLNTKGISTDDKSYLCEQACVVNDVTYYIINEYVGHITAEGPSLVDMETFKDRTGNIYAVDVITGLTFKATLNIETGEYSLSAF